ISPPFGRHDGRLSGRHPASVRAGHVPDHGHAASAMPVTTPAPALRLLRHAQPLIAAGVCYGQLDVPADPHGTLQAALQHTPTLSRCGVVRHSPSQRCEQLAQTLQGLEANFLRDARLQEMHFGRWEGCAWNDIDRAEIDQWSRELYHFAPGGGECLSAMLQRVRAALLESWQMDSQGGTRDVAWVTHAGVIR